MGAPESPEPATCAIGRAPGSLVVPEDAVPSRITVIRYRRDTQERHDDVRAADLPRLTSGPFEAVWVDVAGAASVETFEALIDAYGIPFLAVEDHFHVRQRPKWEPYGESRFLVMRGVQVPGTVEMDQYSIFFTGKIVFTFQHRYGDCLDAVRRRIADPESQLRARGPDYLLYRIVDTLVDSFFPETERLFEELEEVERTAIERPDAKLFRRLHELKVQIRRLERVVLPMRDAASSLTRDEGVFAAETRPYLRDVHDHTQQLVEQLGFLGAISADVGDLVIGTLDVKLNQVMKVLAAVTFVFMPLSFVTSWYGMNFTGMPELHWAWAYPALMVVLAAAAIAMILWLRRRGWTEVEERS